MRSSSLLLRSPDAAREISAMGQQAAPSATMSVSTVRLEAILRIVDARDLSALVNLLPSLLPEFQIIRYFGVGVFEAKDDGDHIRVVSTYRDPTPSLDEEDPRVAATLRTSMEHGIPLTMTPAADLRVTGTSSYFPDLRQELRYSDLFSVYRAAGIRSLLYLPLRTARSFPGALVCGAAQPHAFSPALTSTLKEMSQFVALSLENYLSFQQTHVSRRALEQERNRLQVLLRIGHAMAAELEVESMQQVIMESVYKHIPHRFGSVCEYDAERNRLRMVYVNAADQDTAHDIGEIIPIEATVSGKAYQEQRTVLFRLGPDDAQFPYSADVVRRYRSSWLCALPLSTQRRRIGVLNIGGEPETSPNLEDLAFLEHLTNHLALAMERCSLIREMRQRTEDLERKNMALEHEIEEEFHFEEIVGRSSALRAVLTKVDAVAKTDATVLIQGESGTGKELIARSIHQRSKRKDQAFVKVSCAAIPSGLLESELFGHERGAFTGAVSSRQGRFELANHGTIFLDEIGELPLELQAKLLRVLQEREFERLGSNLTRTTDVRVIAATNRELRAMVAGGRFREDLYYRLSTFPLTSPPLRERQGDIPLLVRYFVQLLSRKLGRNITRIPDQAMKAMERYPWPGNVRELQNFIERAVILSSGDSLQAPLPELEAHIEYHPAHAVTMEDAEREFIVSALEECRWVVGGPNGAAARLGMKRTTLQSRMLKLGIERRPPRR
jgi:formate hydrogenlyase transcriptional activator